MIFGMRRNEKKQKKMMKDVSLADMSTHDLIDKATWCKIQYTRDTFSFIIYA